MLKIHKWLKELAQALADKGLAGYTHASVDVYSDGSGVITLHWEDDVGWSKRGDRSREFDFANASELDELYEINKLVDIMENEGSWN